MNKYLIIILMNIISSSGFIYREDIIRSSRHIKPRTSNIVQEPVEIKHTSNNVDQILSRNVLDIAKQLLTLSTNSNSNLKYQVFSPISIANVLSLLALGSKHNTQTELIKILGFNKVPNYEANPLRVHEEFGLLINSLTKDIQTDDKKFLFESPTIKQKRSSPLTNIDPLSIPSHYRNLKKYHIFRRSIPKSIQDTNINKYDSYNINLNDENFTEKLQSKFNDHEIDIANGIFIQSGYQLKSDYENFVKSIYRRNSDIIMLDFENNLESARQYINDWGKRKTNGKIENLIIDGIDKTTNMIITSALYFRSLWQTSFIENITMKRNFYPNGKSKQSVIVDMMANGGEFLYYDSIEYECRFIGLPFKDNLSTMYIIMPYDSNKEKLHKIQKLLTSDRIDEIISNRMKKKTILLNMPRMHLESSMNLRELFTQMGIKSLFNSRESDLSGIISSSSSFTSTSTSSESIVSKVDKLSLSGILLPKKKDLTINYHRRTSRPLNINQPILFEYDSIPSPSAIKEYEYVINRRNVVKKMINNNRKPRSMQTILINNYLAENYKTKRNIGSKMSSINQYHTDNFDIDDIKLNDNDGKNFQKKISVDDILHKVNLKINEQGIEGAAITVSHLPRNDFDDEFIIDSPFLFLVRHEKTKLPIFYGSIYDPSI